MNRDELIRLMGIAVNAPPMPCPKDEARGGDWVRLPTPDEWAAHVLGYAKALQRALHREQESELQADRMHRLIARSIDRDRMDPGT